MKKAFRKLTKAQKKKASELRIEIDFLERIAKNKTPVFKLMGKKHWCVSYIIVLVEYSKIHHQQLAAGHDIWNF